MASHSHEVAFFVGERLSQRAQQDPDKTALIFRGVATNFSQVDQAVDNLAAHLTQEGVRAGDRVALLLPNCTEFALCYYATQRLGAITVVFDARLKGRELEGVLKDANPCLLVTHASIRPEIADILEKFNDLQQWLVGGTDAPTFDSRLTTAGAAKLHKPTLKPHDSALILYTSGTTGEPKGAVLTHVNLAQFPIVMGTMHRTDASEVWGCLLPMSHVSGPIYCNEIIDKGSSMVIFDQLNPATLLEGIAHNRVTIFHGVPIHFQLLLSAKNRAEFDLSAVRMAGLMGTTIPVSLMHAVKSLLPHAQVIQGYGLTETSPLITLTEADRADQKMASIGKAVPGIEINIVDDQGHAVLEGEIITRGPHVMKGYFGKPEATAERIRDGWLYTGDIGRCDDDGYYYHLGRKDDMIITGGLNVYPAEVENTLCDHPSVREAAVFAMEDTGRGQAIGAAVVIQEGQSITDKELLAFLRKHLAAFKVPQRLKTVEALPRTATGKVRKEELAQAAASW